MFVLSVDDDWTVGTPTCTSSTATNVTNNYVSAAGNNTLNCAVSSKDVYVYGVAQEIDVDVSGTSGSLATEFRFTDLTAPNVDKASSAYNWSITHWRGWSTYKITTWSGTGVDTAPGTLTISSWTTHSSYSASEIVNGLTLYTDITVSGAHAIPSGGRFTLTFTNADNFTTRYEKDVNQADSGTAVYCYVHYNATTTGNLTCAPQSAAEVRITVGSSALAAGTSVTISLLTKFGGSTSATVTGSTTDGTNTIDTAAAAAQTITYAASSDITKANAYSLLFSPDLNQSGSPTRVFTTGDNGSNYIFVPFQAVASSYSNNTAGTFSLYIPAAAGTTLNDHQLRLQATAPTGATAAVVAKYETVSNASATYNGTAVSAFGATEAATLTNSILSFSLNLNNKSGVQVAFLNTLDNTDAVTTLGLPRVETNL